MDDQDYELDNARAWDDSIPPKQESAGRFHWKTMEGSSKVKKSNGRRNKKTKLPPREVRRSAQDEVGSRPSHIVQQRAHLQTGTPRPLPRASPQQLTKLIHNEASQQIRAHGRSLPRPHMIPEVQPDSEAQLAWRERRPPVEDVRIPYTVVHFEREHHEIPHYENLATEHGTFVYCDHLSSGNEVVTFGIWGEVPAARATKRTIADWVEVMRPEGKKAAAASKFARIVSLTPELRDRAERRWMREIKKNQYRQFPPKQKPFGAIGSFHWPTKEYRPEDAFGMSCEALDPIRMDSECYILLNRERSVLQVYGSVSNVKKALNRLRMTAFNMATRSINPARAYLVQTSDIPSYVYLQEHHLPKILSSAPGEVEGNMPGYSPKGEGKLADEAHIAQSKESRALGIERVKATLANALRKVHYMQAHMLLRVRLGTFLLTQFKRLSDDEKFYGMKQYEEMTRASQFAGLVTEELGNDALEQHAFATILQARDLFLPEGAFTEDLRNVSPSYAAEFVFEHEKGNLCLSMSWQLSPSGELMVPSKIWHRLDRDTGQATKLIDMSLTDLRDGSAWQFDWLLSESIEQTKLPKHLHNFANRVKVNLPTAAEERPDEPFIQFNPYATPMKMRQIKRYQYCIKDTEYTLELSQFQDRIYPPQSSPIETVVPTVYERRWAVNVFYVGWDTMFGNNERLPIGTSADWKHDLDTWFPKAWGSKDGAGFEELMEVLEKIQKLLKKPVEK